MDKVPQPWFVVTVSIWVALSENRGGNLFAVFLRGFWAAVRRRPNGPSGGRAEWRYQLSRVLKSSSAMGALARLVREVRAQRKHA